MISRDQKIQPSSIGWYPLSTKLQKDIKYGTFSGNSFSSSPRNIMSNLGLPAASTVAPIDHIHEKKNTPCNIPSIFYLTTEKRLASNNGPRGGGGGKDSPQVNQ